MTAAVRTRLHLIKPLGFELSDKYLKRAGLDYWPETDVHVHEDWQSFIRDGGHSREQLWFVTTKAQKIYHQVEFSENDALVFGNEAVGFPPHYHEQYADRRLLIPMDNANVRSLNLANAVSIVLFEARRQLGR